MSFLKHKKKIFILFFVLLVCVGILWTTAILTVRGYGESTIIVNAADRADGLEISFVENNAGGINFNASDLNNIQGYPDQGDGKAAASGMYININAQMMLAFAEKMGQGAAVSNLLENQLGISDASVCYATSLEIEVVQPNRVIQFTNTSNVTSELKFDYNYLVLNNVDITITEASSSSVVKNNDVLLDDLLLQMGYLDHTYENGIDAALLMNDPYYSMESKTLTGHVQTLLQPNETFYVDFEFPAEDMCAVIIQITSAELTPITSKTISFLPAEYDYTVGETTIAANGSAQSVDIDCVNGTSVNFNVVGKKLGYWIDGNGKVYKSEDADTSVTIKYGRDTMQPVFVNTDLSRSLETGGITYYGWSDAFSNADLYGAVTLISSDETNIANLAVNALSDSYNTSTSFTVPDNIKFVVPHTPCERADGYFYFSKYGTDTTNDSQTSSSQPYSKLWIPEGYSININAEGILLVNGEMTTRSNTQGEIATGFGMIELDGNMNVNGDLIVRGYIAQKNYTDRTSDNKTAHKGHISVSSEGEVNIVFQIMDFRGGTATFATFKDCMPITMYSFDNVMVETSYVEGSVMSAYTVVGMSGLAARTTVPILSSNSNSMFAMDNGAVITTDYQYDGDRFIVNAETGSVSLNYIEIRLFGNTRMTTAAYQLPLHDGMVVNVRDGATVTLDYALKLLPGAEINIDNGATVHLNNRIFLYGLEDYNPAFSLNMSHFRLRTDCALVENGGQNVTPTSDPVLNVAGHIIVGESAANYNASSELPYSTGKVFQSVGMKTGIHAGEGAVFEIPEEFDLSINQDMAPYTTELKGTSAEPIITEYDEDYNDVWTEVKGFIGGMSNRLEDDPDTEIDDRYISFIHEDLAPDDEGYKFMAGEQDGEFVWYRYRIDFKDNDGNVVDTHLVAPAYDELMIGDLVCGGSGHVVNSIEITDSNGYDLTPNDPGGTSITYTGYVGSDYDHAAVTMTEFDVYTAWQGVKIDNLNLAVDENWEPVTEFVVTLGLQESGWLVEWNQTASGSNDTTTWYSFTDPDGVAEYGKPGEFSILNYEVIKDGNPVLGATLSARLETENDVSTTFLMLEGVSFSGDTDSVTVNLTTASEFVNAILHKPDSTTVTARMPVVGGTNALIVSIPQPDNSWYIADTISADGFTPENNKETVTLTWTGDMPANSQVDIYLAEYAYKLVYDITNTSGNETLTFDPVYTNEVSFTQSSANVQVSSGTYKYYFIVENESTLELTTATTAGTPLVTVEADMAAYDYLIQFYNEDVLLKNEFVLEGGEASYTFDAHTAFEGEISASQGSYVNESSNAYLTVDGDLVPAVLAVSNVHSDVNLTVTVKAFDYIVTFFNQNADQLDMQYVVDGGNVVYEVAVGSYITACSDATAVDNDNFTAYTNSISDGWGSVKIDDIHENKAVTLTISAYVTKVVWIQTENNVPIQTTAKYYTESVTNDSITPIVGHVFLSEGYSLGTSNGAAGTISWSLGETAISITSQGDFEITLPLGEYSSRVQFVNSVTNEVEKIVFVNSEGYDMSSSRDVIPYFQYSASAKKMLENVVLVSGTATLTEASSMNFDGDLTSAWRMVEVTDITTDEVVISFTPLAYSRILAVSYTDPWGTENETIYTSSDSYTGTVTGYKVTDVECEDAASATFTTSTWTVTGIPDATDTMGLPTSVPVYISWMSTEERLKMSNFAINLTNNKAAIDITESAYGVFTVTCTQACVVVINNGDGTYSRVNAIPTDNANTYEFRLVNNFSPDIVLEVYFCGDLDTNGAVNNQDLGILKLGILRNTNPNYVEMSNLQKVLGNIDKTGNCNNSDLGLLKLGILRSTNPNYQALPW